MRTRTAAVTATFLLIFPVSAALAAMTLQWARHQSGSDVKGLQVDTDGNIFVLTQAQLVKYTPEGDTTESSGGWVRRGGLAFTCDRLGNIYVTDSNYNFGTGANVWTRKYSPDGALLWQSFYDSPAHADDVPVTMLVDSLLNAYAVGWSIGEGTAKDWLIIKYSPDGDTVPASGGWIRRYNNPTSNSDDVPAAASLSHDAHLHVCGTSLTWSPVLSKYSQVVHLARYTHEGDTVGTGWMRILIMDETAAGITVDALGNSFLATTHTIYNPPQYVYYQWRAAKVDAHGNIEWSIGIMGGADAEAFPRAIGLDPAGNPVMTGAIKDLTSGEPAPRQYRTVKYSTGGVFLWADAYDPLLGDFDAFPGDLAVASSGHVFVTGACQSYSLSGGNHAYQYMTLCYDPSGAPVSEANYKRFTTSAGDIGGFVRLDPSGNVIVTGTASLQFGGYEVTTLKYATDVYSDVREIHDAPLPTEYVLEQNYPNPFNASTLIRFSLPRESRVSLAVYNVLGQRVRDLADGLFSEGTYQVDWDGKDNRDRPVASGVYLYNLRAGNTVQVRKMLLVK